MDRINLLFSQPAIWFCLLYLLTTTKDSAPDGWDKAIHQMWQLLTLIMGVISMIFVFLEPFLSRT